MELMSRLWSPTIKDDPLAFVLLTFPWGEQGTPLEHFHGPRKWQRQSLADIRDHIKANQGKTSTPGSQRMHDMSDGVFVGAMLNPATPTRYINLNGPGITFGDEFGNTISSSAAGWSLNGVLIAPNGKSDG